MAELDIHKIFGRASARRNLQEELLEIHLFLSDFFRNVNISVGTALIISSITIFSGATTVVLSDSNHNFSAGVVAIFSLAALVISLLSSFWIGTQASSAAIKLGRQLRRAPKTANKIAHIKNTHDECMCIYTCFVQNMKLYQGLIILGWALLSLPILVILSIHLKRPAI